MNSEKKLYLMAGFFLILTCCALQLTFAQEANQDQDKPPVPKIKLSEKTIDFGTVNGGTKLKAEIKFSNEGNAPLRIKKVRPSCGCMTGKLEKKVYQPGESGTVDFSYEAKNKKGPTKGYVTISSDDPDQPNVKVYIKADVIQFIETNPGMLAFQNIENNENSTRKIHVTAKKPVLITTRLEKPEQEGLKIEVTPKEQIVTEKGADFNVTLTPSVVGRYTNRIILKAAKDLERPIQLKTSLTANVSDIVVASPKSLFFPIEKDKNLTRTIIVGNRDDVNEPISIEHLDYDKEMLDIKEEPTEKKGAVKLLVSSKSIDLGTDTNRTSNIKIKAKTQGESVELSVPARFYKKRARRNPATQQKKPRQQPKPQKKEPQPKPQETKKQLEPTKTNP
ncbi:MAG: DUF1573 domain-containing protein [Planctomycetota bacterium]